MAKPAFVGAGVALLLLSALLFSTAGVRYGYWVLLPVFTVAAGGAFGGALYFVLVHLRAMAGRRKALAVLLGALVYMLSVWLSAVAAFSLTGHWH